MEQLSHKIACTKEPGTNTGLRNTEDSSDLNAGEFLKRRKNENLAFLCWELVYTGEHVGVMLRGSCTLLGREARGWQHTCQLCNVIGFRAGLGTSLAIQNDVPDDANEPDTMVAHFSQGIAVAKNAQERLLYSIFCIRSVPQNGISNAVKRRRVLVHKCRERFILVALANFVIHVARGDLHPSWKYRLACAHTWNRRKPDG